jgi:hypothetical protein
MVDSGSPGPPPRTAVRPFRRIRGGWGWLILPCLALAPVSAMAQVYCSRWAEVRDAPTHIRRGPSAGAAVACRLPRNGQRLLVYPLLIRAGDPPPQWLATLVCRPAGQRAAIGLGLPPDYVHRSQVRLLGINPEDWLGPSVGEEPGPCGALWRPYGEFDPVQGR